RVVELGRAARSSAGVKTRTPLPKLIVVFDANDRDRGALDSASELAEIVKDELNVKAIEVRDAAEGLVKETVKPDLKVLGPKLEISDRIALRYDGPISRAFERYGDFIAQEALATKISQGLHDRGHKWEGELNGVAGKIELEKE